MARVWDALGQCTRIRPRCCEPLLAQSQNGSPTANTLNLAPMLSSLIHQGQYESSDRPNVVARGGRQLTACIFHSPSSVPASFVTDSDKLESVYRPLHAITPLDPDSLHRIPLSTPPRRNSTPDATREEVSSTARLDQLSLDDSEAEFPLILVTGEEEPGL